MVTVLAGCDFLESNVNGYSGDIIIFVSDKLNPLPDTPYGERLRADDRVLLVDSSAEMKERLSGDTCAIVVTRDVALAGLVDRSWLQEQYRNGLAIAAIGLNIGELYEILQPGPHPSAATRGVEWNWDDRLSEFGLYSVDRVPIAYFIQTGQRFAYGGDAQRHPLFGWASIDRLLSQVGCAA